MAQDTINIFKDAKFGDKFLTKSGDLAIFIQDGYDVCKLFIEDYDTVFCDKSGRYKGYIDSNFDIVSKYCEPIDEEKLDELAFNAEKETFRDCTLPFQTNWVEGFKTGYRKAKEE